MIAPYVAALATRAGLSKKSMLLLVISVLSALSIYEGVVSYMGSVEVSKLAHEIVGKAHANSSRQKVIALRDYLRQHIRWQELSSNQVDGRPFLRDSAIDTLRSGEGFCGEVTRAFICMAASLGIEAQRINLVGKKLHVVAECDLGSEGRFIVDCQNPPQVEGLETLDAVIARPDYDDYYTLNLRRLHVTWLISRVKLENGFITNLFERPHALKSLMWGSITCLILTLWGARLLLRWFLHQRGWVHVSNQRAIEAALRRTST